MVPEEMEQSPEGQEEAAPEEEGQDEQVEDAAPEGVEEQPAAAQKSFFQGGPRLILALLVLAAAVYMLSRSMAAANRTPFDEMLMAEKWPMERSMEYGFQLQHLDGTPLNMEDMRGKVLVINLFATWQRQCAEELASLERLQKKVKDSGVVVMPVAYEPLEDIREYVKKCGLSIPVYVLPATGNQGGDAPGVLRTESVPTTFVVTADGAVVLKYPEPADWDRSSVVKFLKRAGK